MLKLIGSKPLYMWQIDRQIYVEDDSVKWVDFAHETDEKALRVEVKEAEEMQVADIPNILLQSKERIRVWFVGEHGNTICGDVLNPIWRNQPADYVYTETEIKSYESLEARIEALEQNGGGNAECEVSREEFDALVDEVADLKENGNIGTDFGGVEITDGEPTKETTVMTLNPNAEEVNLYTAEEIDEMLQNLPSGEGDSLDVQINGESIVENGVANIPLATQSTYGLSKPLSANYGITMLGAGTLVVAQANKVHIDGRANTYTPITPNNLDYALKQAMCDGKGAEWTEEEKKFASERMGISGNKTLLGEVVATGHKKIQPLAIDFATGIVTVDDCSFLPSDKVAYTKFRLCVRKKTDAFYPNNVIPQELYGGVGVQKISDNTLYLYQGSTKIESFTESATIDLNAWYLEYSEVETSHITVDLTGMEFGNHLQVELFNPNAEVQSVVVMTTVVRDNENNQYLGHNQTDGIRPVNGDIYSFDSVRSIPSGSNNANKVKGNAMPIRYIYDFIVDGDFIYVTGKNIFSVADNKDKLPVYYTEEKSILLQNKGLTKIGMTLGTQYLMIPEGSYVKVWEVHD